MILPIVFEVKDLKTVQEITKTKNMTTMWPSLLLGNLFFILLIYFSNLV